MCEEFNIKTNFFSFNAKKIALTEVIYRCHAKKCFSTLTDIRRICKNSDKCFMANVSFPSRLKYLFKKFILTDTRICKNANEPVGYAWTVFLSHQNQFKTFIISVNLLWTFLILMIYKLETLLTMFMTYSCWSWWERSKQRSFFLCLWYLSYYSIK